MRVLRVASTQLKAKEHYEHCINLPWYSDDESGAQPF